MNLNVSCVGLCMIFCICFNPAELYIYSNTPAEYITESTTTEYNHLQNTTEHTSTITNKSSMSTSKQPPRCTSLQPKQQRRTPKSQISNSNIPKRETLHDVTSHTHFFASSIGPSSKTTVIPFFFLSKCNPGACMF